MKRLLNVLLPVVIVAGLVALFWSLTHGLTIDVLDPKGEVAREQKDLLVFTTALSLIVVLPVFTLLGIFSLKYRAGNTKSAYLPNWGENKLLEIIWWGIPIIIIGVLGVVIVQTSHSLDPYKQRAGDDPIKIQVMALQWKWLFMYPEYNVATLNYAPIPIDRPVTFEMSADAPMSAFWIPSLGSQVYAMNGMKSTLNLKASEVGSYTGYTTNINGAGYATMTFDADVMTADSFNAWVRKSAQSRLSLDMDQYRQLSKQKSETDERTYRMSETTLFNQINGEDMHAHMNHESSQE